MSPDGSNIVRVVESLTQRHPYFDRGQIERWVAEVYESYRLAPIQTFVPILIHREIDAHLRQLETAAGLLPQRPPATQEVFDPQPGTSLLTSPRPLHLTRDHPEPSRRRP